MDKKKVYPYPQKHPQPTGHGCFKFHINISTQLIQRLPVLHKLIFHALIAYFGGFVKRVYNFQFKKPYSMTASSPSVPAPANPTDRTAVASSVK